MYGQHVKALSFQYCRVSSTLIEMLQCCSNVQHLSLPSIKLDPEQLQKIIHLIGCLHTLEIKVDYNSNIGHLFSNTSHLKEITIISDSGPRFGDLFKYWREMKCRPPSCNVIACGSTKRLVAYAAQINTVPTGTTANFRTFSKLSPSFPALNYMLRHLVTANVLKLNPTITGCLAEFNPTITACLIPYIREEDNSITSKKSDDFWM